MKIRKEIKDKTSMNVEIITKNREMKERVKKIAGKKLGKYLKLRKRKW